MLLTDLVAPDAIVPALKVNSKKQILQELAAKAAELCGQSESSVQADGFDLAVRGVRHRRFTAVGEHDRRAVRSIEHENLVPRREQRCFRTQECDLFRADGPDIGNPALAERRESFGRHRRTVHCGPVEHGTCSSRFLCAWGHYRPRRTFWLYPGPHSGAEYSRRAD